MWFGDAEPKEFSIDDSGQVRWGSQGAGLLIVTKRGSKKYVLLTLRSAYVMDPYVWGITGGRVERYHKNPYETALIETGEELGPIPEAVLKSFKPLNKDLFRSGGFQYTTFIVAANHRAVHAWKPRLNWENSAYAHVPIEEALTLPLHPNVQRILEGLI